MPKKNEELKAKAKELYEQEGFSLAGIAQELDVSAGTVRSWKSRGKWQRVATPVATPVTEYEKRNVATKLSNLQPIQPGEQRAKKHGLYADNSQDPEYQEYRSQALDSIGKSSQEAFADVYANFMVAIKHLEVGKLEYLEPLARVLSMVVGSGEKAVKTQLAELDKLEKEQLLSGEDPGLDLISDYLERVRENAFRSYEETE